MIKFFTKTAVALALASSGAAFATTTTTVDLFSIDQMVGVYSNRTEVDHVATARSPANSTFGGVVSSSKIDGATPSSILGTERDIAITQATGLTTARGVQAGADVGEFVISNDTGVRSTVVVQWDGVDNSANLNTTGLGGVDLLGGTGNPANAAFSVGVNSADHGFDFTIDIYDMSGKHSFITLISNQHDNPVTTSISLDAFVFSGTCSALVLSGFGTPNCNIDPLLDLSQVGAIQVTFVGTTANLDMAIDQIQSTVPEPGALALVGLALAGAGFASRRRKAA